MKNFVPHPFGSGAEGRLRPTSDLNLLFVLTAIVIAEAAGPLRSAAATLLELEGIKADSPTTALEQGASSLPEAGILAAVHQLPSIRESRSLPPGTGPQIVFQLLALADAMRVRTDRVT